MTRENYFTIAAAIKAAFPSDTSESIKNSSYNAMKAKLLKELIPRLQKDNPSFQSFRFITACDAIDLLDAGKIEL